jgi:hypothetical protein
MRLNSRLSKYLAGAMVAASLAAPLMLERVRDAVAQGFNLAGTLLPGTAMQPTIGSNLDSTTGLYFPAAGQLALSNGGTQSMLCGTTIGGTSSPGCSVQRAGSVFRKCSIDVGSVAYGSLGNATTYVNGTIYWASVYLDTPMTVTSLQFLNAGTVGTNNIAGALYNSAGTLIANSALAGALTSGANAFQGLNLTAPIAIPAGRYWIALQANGTTDNTRTVAASTFVNVLTASTTGTFGTFTALTPPTTFTANVGPIACLSAT